MLDRINPRKLNCDVVRQSDKADSVGDFLRHDYDNVDYHVQAQRLRHMVEAHVGSNAMELVSLCRLTAFAGSKPLQAHNAYGSNWKQASTRLTSLEMLRACDDDIHPSAMSLRTLPPVSQRPS